MNVRHVLDEGSARRSGRHRILAHVAARPSLWWASVASAIRFAPRGWWRRPPFLPRPDARYWRFRMETAYGDPDAEPSLDDLVVAIRWSRGERGATRRARRASATALVGASPGARTEGATGSQG